MTHTLHIDHTDCIGCGQCLGDCPARNLELRKGKARPIRHTCIFCGHCVAICPTGAVSISGYPEAPMALEKGRTLDPDDLLYAIKSRRTIRQFQSRPIPREILDHIIEAGRFTPTAKNRQDVEYLILDESKRAVEDLAVAHFRKLRERTGKGPEIGDDFFFFGGDKVILVLADRADDASLAAGNMALLAEAHGLGVLICAYFTRAAGGSKPIQEALGISKNKPIQVTLVLGYPKVTYARGVQREPAKVTYR